MSQPDSSDVHVPGSGGNKKRVMPKKKLNPGNMPPGMGHYLSKLKELLKGKVSADDWDAAVKSARGHAGGKMKGQKSADEGADPAADTSVAVDDGMPADDASDTQDDPTPAPVSDGVMIAYMLKPEEAAQLVIDGGEAAADLHMTLCYLGKQSELPADVAQRATAALSALAYGTVPLPVESTGIDRFEAEDTHGLKDVVYATVDNADNVGTMYCDLASFRDRIYYELVRVGLSPRNDYGGWVPHITLAYVAPDSQVDVTLPDADMLIDTITLMVGGERTDFALTGNQFPMGMLYTDRTVSLADACKAGEPWRLFNEAPGIFAEPPEWMPVLPIPGNYKHPVYGAIDITPERNANFVGNFNDGVYQEKVPIDAEHETKLSGAVGYVVELRQNDDGSVDGRAEWNERGTALIEGDRYAYVSPEWYEQWADPISGESYDDILIGVALTNHPYFKDKALRPLVASERGIASTERPVGGEYGDGGTFTPWTASEAPVTGTAAKDDKAPVDKAAPPAAMSEDVARRFAEMEATITAERTAREAAESSSKALAETVAGMTKEARRKQFSDMIVGKDGAGDGAMWVGDRAAHLSTMEALADTIGEDSDIFKSYVANQRSVAALVKTSAAFAEMGVPEGSNDGAAHSVTAEVETRAAKLMAENPKLSHAAATTQIVMSDPVLAGRYRDERRANGH